ncbi:MAG: DUF349 domain-containing protein [Rudaea sp.]
MKLSQLLFKPKWQDKDPGVRRASVAGDSDAELLASLPELARNDADGGVRLAALKRLNLFELWRDRSQHDANDDVRKSAREACLNLMCSPDVDSPPLAMRMQELAAFDEDDLERIASSAAPTSLRGAALARTSRPRFLAQRASADPDSQLRLTALQRVDDLALLERIAESTRKTDKVVSRLARERLGASRVAAGDEAAIGLRAHELCERIEALMRSPHASIDSELAELDANWRALGDKVPEDLQARYLGARTLTLRAVDELKNPRTGVVPVADEPAPSTASVESTSAQAQLEALASKARFAADVEAARAHERAERERELELHEQIRSLLGELDRSLNQGGMHAAHALYARAHAAIAALDETPTTLNQSWTDLEARYAELKRWQYWSNMQRRRELCADIEALAGSGMHPDALATKVRDAREEWQRLDAAEGHAGEGAAPETGISRRFQAVCHRALRPLKAYFSKRKEVRQNHTEEVDALLIGLEAVADDCSDWAQLATLRREASTALRSLDVVEPRARTQLAKRLKNAIARLGMMSRTHEEQVAQSKQSLIERAQALSAQTDSRAVVREARELQKRWTALGNGRRGHDQRQWREFRAACDAAFGKLDEARKAQAEDVKAQRAKAQELLSEFESLAANETGAADEIRQSLRKLDEQWQALAIDDRQMHQRLRDVRESISARLKDSARRKRLAPYTSAMKKYALLRSIENGATLDADAWSQQPESAPKFDEALARRFANANQIAPTDSTANDNDARELLVRLEFLGGLESPAEDHQLRMQLQVQRLSSRMRNGPDCSPEQELDALLASWFAQPAQAQALEVRFEQSAKNAIQALP